MPYTLAQAHCLPKYFQSEQAIILKVVWSTKQTGMQLNLHFFKIHCGFLAKSYSCPVQEEVNKHPDTVTYAQTHTTLILTSAHSSFSSKWIFFVEELCV